MLTSKLNIGQIFLRATAHHADKSVSFLARDRSKASYGLCHREAKASCLLFSQQRSKHIVVPASTGGGGTGSGGGGRLGGGGGGGGGGFGEGGNLPQRLAYGFAILLAIGGYIGYRKKGSKASLKASGSFAALLLAAGYLIGGPYPTAGLAIALAVNLALGTYMVKGFFATKKPFPQGVFSVVSAINSVIYIRSLSGL